MLSLQPLLRGRVEILLHLRPAPPAAAPRLRPAGRLPSLPVSRRLSTILPDARSRGPSSSTTGTPRRSQWKNFAPGDWPFAIVHLRADILRDPARPLPAPAPALRPCDKSAPAPLCTGASLRRQHQPLVVGMAHDQPADQPRAHAPAGLPHVIELPFLVLKLARRTLCRNSGRGRGWCRPAAPGRSASWLRWSSCAARPRISRRCVFTPLITGMAITSSATSA